MSQHSAGSRLVSLTDTGTRLGCKKTKVYELIKQGRLDAVKLGSRTLVIDESIDRLMASLPRVGE
jgi:excisionase family DNA binding protein